MRYQCSPGAWSLLSVKVWMASVGPASRERMPPLPPGAAAREVSSRSPWTDRPVASSRPFCGGDSHGRMCACMSAFDFEVYRPTDRSTLNEYTYLDVVRELAADADLDGVPRVGLEHGRGPDQLTRVEERGGRGGGAELWWLW